MKTYTPQEIIDIIKESPDGEFLLRNGNGDVEFRCTIDEDDDTLNIFTASKNLFGFVQKHTNEEWSSLYLSNGSYPPGIADNILLLNKLSKYTGYMPKLPESIKVEHVSTVETIQRVEPVESKTEMMLAGKVEAYENILIRNGGRNISITG